MADNPADNIIYFPPKSDKSRLEHYEYYENLFMGNHFDAFAIKINNEIWSKEYRKMRYVVCNFAGLISKVIADMLFIEPPKILVKDGDQEYIDGIIRENKLRIKNYESALSNSYLGDALYKLRVGKRNPSDTESSVIIEDITPKIYFPHVNPSNVKSEPEVKELAWKLHIGDKEYVRKELHTVGKIENQLWLLEDDQLKSRESLTLLGKNAPPDEEQTKIDRSLIVHIANWRAGNRHFGLSDYFDLEQLFYAINNRVTKIDNILDKHSDPILALPEGILDERGQVRKEKLGLFERPEGVDKNSDPSYITWDANLESAISEIEKLVEMTFMMSETSPDILGMGQGQAESGRALKLKLLRTVAKAQRKQLYYTEGLREVIYTAQLLAKQYNIKIDGKTMQGNPVYPEIVWSDGLPTDMTELIEQEAARMDAGLTTKKDSLMRLDDIDEDTAEKKSKEIDKETELALPETGSFGKGLNSN